MSLTTIGSINTQLATLRSGANFGNVLSIGDTVKKQVNTLESTTLGVDVGENKAGFETVTVTAAPPGLGANVEETKTVSSTPAGSGAAPVARLTEDVPGVDLKTTPNSSDLSKGASILGTSPKEVLNKIVITTPTPEGVKAALLAAGQDVSSGVMSNILNEIVPTDLQENIDSIIDNTFGEVQETIQNAIDTAQGSVDNLLGGLTGNLLQDVVLKVNQASLEPIVALGVDTTIAQQAFNTVVGGTANKLVEAAELIAANQINEVLLSVPEIEKVLSFLNISVAGQIQSGLGIRPERVAYDTRSNANTWNGASTEPFQFTKVTSAEEVAIEFGKSTREMTEVVFFAYETAPNQVFTASDIHVMENTVGGDGISMHYVILPNGLVQRGRPLTKVSSGLEGHTDYAVYVGIIRHKDAVVTAKQVTSINAISKAFYAAVPGGQLLAASEIDEEYPNPGIDIAKIVTNNGKQNLGVTNQAYSSQQLIEAAQMFYEQQFDPAIDALPTLPETVSA